MPHNDLHIGTWNALLNGEHAALEDLYNQHYIGLLNYGIKLIRQREAVRDSIFQLFLHLWDNRQKLPEVLNVRSYLITCLHRQLLAGLRKSRSKRISGAAWEQLYPATEFSYEDHLVQIQQNRELSTTIMIAFNKLSKREKELLRLKFFEDRDYDEIARRCNISKRTAYNIVHAALKTLKHSLSGEAANRKRPGFVYTALRTLLF